MLGVASVQEYWQRATRGQPNSDGAGRFWEEGGQEVGGSGQGVGGPVGVSAPERGVGLGCGH